MKLLFRLKQEWVIVSAIFLVGISILALSVPFPVFWLDESMAVNFTYQANDVMISDLLVSGAHPPLYYFIVKTIRIVFGDTEAVLRLVSALFFIFGGLFVYLLARDIGGKKTGYISLVLWFSNYFLIFYAKQVRPYSLMAFLSVASSYFLYKLLQGFKWKYALWYIIFGLMGLYTNYWFVLVFLSQVVILLITDRKNWKVLWAMFAQGLLFLPWGLIYILKFNNYESGEFIGPANLSMLRESLSYFATGQWLIVSLAILVGISGAFLFRNVEALKAKILGCLFIVPIVSAFLISQFIPIYTPGRREIVALPFFIILVAYIISRIDDRRWQASVSILLVLFTFQNVFDRGAMTKEWKDNDKEIIQNAVNASGKNDYYILYGLSNANFIYYTRRMNLGYDPKIIYFPEGMSQRPDSLGPIQALEKDGVKLNYELENLLDKIKSVKAGKIFLFTHDDAISPNVVDLLDSNLKKMDEIIPRDPHMGSWIGKITIYEGI